MISRAQEKDLVPKSGTIETSTLDDFTPPPVSKRSDGNDVQSLWQNLLINIKSPATKALLHLATPVKISAEEVIITFKNDKLVSQINDTNKKQMLVEAANTMFNQQDSKVTVRIAQAGDAELIKKSIEKKTLDVIKNEPIKPSEKTDVVLKSDSIKEIEKDSSKTTEGDAKKEESDQEKMVLELFDGKFIE